MLSIIFSIFLIGLPFVGLIALSMKLFSFINKFMERPKDFEYLRDRDKIYYGDIDVNLLNKKRHFDYERAEMWLCLLVGFFFINIYIFYIQKLFYFDKIFLRLIF